MVIETFIVFAIIVAIVSLTSTTIEKFRQEDYTKMLKDTLRAQCDQNNHTASAYSGKMSEVFPEVKETLSKAQRKKMCTSFANVICEYDLVQQEDNNRYDFPHLKVYKDIPKPRTIMLPCWNETYNCCNKYYKK